jgi:hypothetical protein
MWRNVEFRINWIPVKSVDEVLTKAYLQPQIKAAESRIRSAEAQTEVSKQHSGLH